MRLTGLLIAFFLMTAMPGVTPALAADNAPQTRLDARTKALMEGLDQNQLRQLASIRESHGTIKAVENVQASVRNAVSACVAKNPDMKDQMNSRHDNWRHALRPTMKQAQSKLEKMILLQSFAKPSEVRSYLKMFDAAIAESNARVKAVPITEKAECEKLLKSMDKTEADLIRLITRNLALDQPLKQKEM
jgi:hypothetical protein